MNRRREPQQKKQPLGVIGGSIVGVILLVGWMTSWGGNKTTPEQKPEADLPPTKPVSLRSPSPEESVRPDASDWQGKPATDEAKPSEVASKPSSEPSTTSDPSRPSIGSSKPSKGGPEHVSGYYNKNGKWVAPYTRK